MKQCRGCKKNYDKRYADDCFACNNGEFYEPICKFRFGVECSSNACEKCGWNPIVEAKRLEEVKNGKKIYLKIDLSKVRGRE